jgi:AcrR family transcriptional regulator
MDNPVIGRRERKKGITRQALLRAAIELFSERGFYDTRVEDITERVDLAKGAFYNYFESKETLLAELILEGVKILERDHLSKLQADSTLPGHLDDLVRLYGQFFDAHPEYLMLIHQARGLLQLHGRPGSERVREVVTDLLQRLARLLAPEAELDEWTLEERLDFAAGLAGGVAGYRSFKVAASLGPVSLKTQGALASALAHSMDELRRARRQPAKR